MPDHRVATLRNVLHDQIQELPAGLATLAKKCPSEPNHVRVLQPA
eukprot:CAMPEP_0204332800 /NCGR_PEP_ID=MMETSP0469-20131031/16747_1 /ASSEMBLY_ACC=CAM_ASM_000384 /TAXON_ID=2969 /ORGANISM="Oxyrrhis marina" /LENGTH=44 /DNA_ID= /DNA_START= /DNA_END= /DNA_ORIENTATION=